MVGRLLDLFSCEGGAARGYAAAGWQVTGVDTDARAGRRYPYEFIHGDALAYLAAHGHEYDAIHASPPCQAYTHATVANPKARAKHPQLIEPTRALLIETGRPYVIENVPMAPLLNPLMLCGSMFDLAATDTDGSQLRLQRHRLFESNVALMAPGPCRHDTRAKVGGVYGGGSVSRHHAENVRHGGYTPSKAVRAALIGVPDGALTLYGLSQCIPPAYTQWIGEQLTW